MQLYENHHHLTSYHTGRNLHANRQFCFKPSKKQCQTQTLLCLTEQTAAVKCIHQGLITNEVTICVLISNIATKCRVILEPPTPTPTPMFPTAALSTCPTQNHNSAQELLVSGLLIHCDYVQNSCAC